MMLRTLLVAAVFTASGFAQTTFIVDDDGGVGVDFTTIAAAVAAAQPGDRIVVHGGTYGAFTLSEGVSVLALGQPRLTGSVAIQALPAGQTAILAGFRFELHYSASPFSVTNCAGTVIVDACTLRGTGSGHTLAEVTDSTDVRFHRARILPDATSIWAPARVALRVSGSRVELTACELVGGRGGSGVPDPRRGAYGLDCMSGSRVHVARSTVRGGKGGDGDHTWTVNGANGGDAIHAVSGSSVIVAGDATDVIRGGLPGEPDEYAGPLVKPGFGAWGDHSSTLRHSGVPIVLPNNAPGISWSGPVVAPPTPDPTLELLGTPTAGASLLLAFHGLPGQNARLQQGNAPLLVDDGLSAIEKLNNRIRLHSLGPITPTGEASYSATVASTSPLGWTRLFQGLQIDPFTGSLDERTNSITVIVR
jgi:hypothetical protein